MSASGRKWISFIIPLAVLAVVFSFFRPYSTSDEICINMLLNGVGGKGSPGEMLVFLNVILGLFLKAFCLLAPGFPWLEMFLYCTLLVSAWSLFFSLLPEKTGIFTAAMVVGVLSLIFFRYFLHPQYTSVAFACGTAGIIALARKLRDPKNRPGFLFSAGLMFVSFLFRAEAFWGVLLVLSPFLVFQFAARKLNLKKAAGFALKFGLSILAAGFFHWAYYQSSPGWSGIYSRFAYLSGTVWNRVITDSPEVEQRLENLGLDWTDYQMICNGLDFDPKFDNGKLKAFDDALPPPARGKGMGWLAVFQMQYVQVLMLAAALCMIGLSNQERLMLMVQSAWVLAVLAGLFYFARLPGDHVVIPAVSLVVLAGLFELTEPVKTKKSRALLRTAGWIGFALWIMAVVPLLGFEWKQNRFFHGVEAEIIRALRELKPAPDQLFVACPLAFPFEAVGVFDNQILKRDFSIYLLGWNQATPWAAEVLESFGIKNLIRDSAGRKDVFFIFPRYLWSIYLDYARKNYGLNLKPVPVFQDPYFQVSRVERVDEKQGKGPGR